MSAKRLKNLIQHAREAPKIHQESPGTIVVSSGGKYSPTIFHPFRASYFSSFQNFAPRILDTVITPGANTLKTTFDIHK